MKYRVLRQHYGDKEYYPGDSRELRETDAKQLVELGVLEEEKTKADKPQTNKARKAAPENKSQD